METISIIASLSDREEDFVWLLEGREGFEIANVEWCDRDEDVCDRHEVIAKVTIGRRDDVLRLWAEAAGATFTPAAEAA